MTAFGKIWIFYDKKKSKKSKALTLVQAQSTLLSLINKDPQRYYIWTPGWEEWVPLDQFLSTKQTYFALLPETDKVRQNIDDLTLKSERPDDEDRTMVISDLTETITKMIYTQIAAELPQKSSDYGYYYPDFNADEIDIKIKTPRLNGDERKSFQEKDRRIETRHNFKMEIIIVSKKGKTFKTYSDNLSLGGTLLQDPLPRDFLNAPFDLIFVNRFETDSKKSRLYFNCKVVGDFKDPKRLMFVNPEPKTIRQLESMIQAYISYQNSIQKKSG